MVNCLCLVCFPSNSAFVAHKKKRLLLHSFNWLHKKDVEGINRRFSSRPLNRRFDPHFCNAVLRGNHNLTFPLQSNCVNIQPFWWSRLKHCWLFNFNASLSLQKILRKKKEKQTSNPNFKPKRVHSGSIFGKGGHKPQKRVNFQTFVCYTVLRSFSLNGAGSHLNFIFATQRNFKESQTLHRELKQNNHAAYKSTTLHSAHFLRTYILINLVSVQHIFSTVYFGLKRFHRI